MRFGIPKYRLPREVLDAEIARIVALGVTIELNSKVERRAGSEARRRLRRRVPGRRRTHRQARLPAGRQRRQDARRGRRPAQHGRRGAPAAWTPRRGVRRRQHGARRGADGQATRRRGIDDRLPTHARKDARPRYRARGGIAGRRAGEVALDDPPGRRVVGHGREDDARRQGHGAADRRIRDARSRYAWCWRSARTSTWRCSTACPASKSTAAWSRSTRT